MRLLWFRKNVLYAHLQLPVIQKLVMFSDTALLFPLLMLFLLWSVCNSGSESTDEYIERL
jgi:hypothetical protein